MSIFDIVLAHDFVIMLPKQLVGASLKPIILTLLSGGEMYGYQIIRQVKALSDGQISWSASKLYPVLHQLENQGHIRAVWRPSVSGPDRKYYRLTDKGGRALESAKHDWHAINVILFRLWGPALQAG